MYILRYQCVFHNTWVVVQKIKYLRIITDSKLNFREYIMYIATKCTKLIYSLSKSAKQSWGLSHKALYTIYKWAILPLLLYGAPVWIEALEKECNKTVYNRVQHLINIKIAKALQTTSNEALCTLTGLTSITIKAEEAAKLNNTRKSQVMRLTTKYSQKTSFTQQTHSESLNNKMSTLYKVLQMAARASMGSELE